MKIEESIGETLVIIRGAGDLATGTAVRLHNCGFKIIMLESSKPTVIRTTVSFATAVFEKEQTVEGVTAVNCEMDDVNRVLEDGKIAVVVDPEGKAIERFKPCILVDAILAKKNLGTTKDMARFVVALGPGFTAGLDCDAVIETQRGHTLGKVIYQGSAIPNTGIPGIVGNYGKERVMHSPCAGVFKSNHKIGDIVKAGEIVAYVGNEPVRADIDGKLRGLLTNNLEVPEHFKIADVDPRGKDADHTTCSDKARNISGGVLEAIIHFLVENK